MAARKMSIAICTRNRARLLAGTLESLCLACAPRYLNWEVIVVLNNCTDDSHEVVETFRSRLPIVSESEPRIGLSHARNRVIDRASGDVIVWIDDDVRVSTQWLCAYERAFLESDGADLFGGPILPSFEGTPPGWLIRHWRLCETAFAVRHVQAGDPEITPATKHRPFGANFAVRASEQQRHRYDLRLGSQPGRTLWAGEETKVIRDILAAGGRGRWVSAALVHHVMPPERQTPRYLRSYFQSYGVRVGLRSRQRRGPSASSAGLPNLADVVRAECRFRWLRAVAGPDRWIPALKRAARTRGAWLARYEDEDAMAVQATASARASDAPLT